MQIKLRIFFILISFCISISIPAQNSKKGFHQVSAFKKNFARIHENIYACKYETSNLDYLHFLMEVKSRMNPAIYQSLLPDTLRWRDTGNVSETYVNRYLRHPDFADYPVVNISYEQANFYCTWLTQKYNSDPKRPFKKAVFKLPSRKEWMEAASGSDTSHKFPWGKNLSAKPKKMLVNYCVKNYTQKVWFDSVYTPSGKVRAIDSVLITTECHPYGSYSLPMKVNLKKAVQNKWGLYHIAGNVSEMVSSKGDCAGGNYLSYADWMRMDAPNEFYPGFIPCPLIGFRIFMQVLEK